MDKLKTSKRGQDLIKRFESLSLTAYVCPAGKLTIGWGSLSIDGKPVEADQVITVDEAQKQFEKDLERFELAVNQMVKVSINQNQFDALVSFAYNVGSGALQSSTLLKLLNNEDYAQAANQFLRWDKANGKTLRGLSVRRQAERDLFLDFISPSDMVEETNVPKAPKVLSAKKKGKKNAVS